MTKGNQKQRQREEFLRELWIQLVQVRNYLKFHPPLPLSTLIKFYNDIDKLQKAIIYLNPRLQIFEKCSTPHTPNFNNL